MEADIRKHVLEIANNLFKEHGYNQTSMERIAKESEISRRTLFRLFNSKSEILYLSNEDVLEDTIEGLMGESFTLKLFIKKLIQILDNTSYSDKVNYMETMNKLKSEPDFQSQTLYKFLKVIPTLKFTDDDPHDTLKGAFFGNIFIAWSKIVENPTIDSLDIIKQQLIEFEKTLEP
ncbi:TetR/AcrR family transcriptional regulator [Staphylococcus pseudoxylosus]|uniref:TetR/AcrR family transcriptional regulator n=1 Tax=Staphylococcus pseudoxylosus TaxID=2282419 RepID=UPI000D1D34D7|nr:helix-turn-helix domain-containing protein [Staphylococcus pseudoxylosus]MEB6036528.1 TetR/AcrR family transcriptional regulator [Staphylococcus pseudoxylosus]MEB7763536.1 TetR/AcrR family transcriptional regulator [Staphylococcus pseudoxylosus]MEB8085885.1 TetR/AcrR family transcriptional regulator [Staphylococcus pseudoxylosus]PTI46080.1 TetR family transcriptional regulator [Staphylococcus xylosus]